MMVVVALVGILTGLVAISWKRITYKIKVLGAVEELRNAVQLARSDAVTKRRNSGLLLDVPARRYLRFIDSSNAPVSSNGRFDSGEVVTQDWTDLPAQMLLLSVSSSLSPVLAPRPCGSPAVPATRTTQSAQYSIVFRPDGSAWATLDARLGVESFPQDTFRLNVFPPTGLIQLEK
ncbi:MAG: GspH/FimT family pseudopilin [Fibrobacteres bacterium]|nr:GspH/FimT family pseudopilin [Fibrobacterota bacterium]